MIFELYSVVYNCTRVYYAEIKACYLSELSKHTISEGLHFYYFSVVL